MKLLSSIINGNCEGFCFIKTVEKKLNRNEKEYLDMTIADSEGEVSAKLWDYSSERYGFFQPGEIIKVRGTVDTWNGQIQFKIEKIRRKKDDDCIEMSDLIPSSPRTGQSMYEEIMKEVEKITDSDYSRLVKTIYEDNREKILVCSAALKMHHAINGGLLYHTLAVLKTSEAIAEIYPFLNKDIIITGAVLHDIEKVNELIYGDTGIATGYSVKGNLLGHIAAGVSVIQKYGEELGIPEEKILVIQHILLSHHTQPEYGSPVAPMFPEAAVIAEADNLDAHLFEMCSAVKDINEGEITPLKVFGLDRKLYKTSKNMDYSIK